MNEKSLRCMLSSMFCSHSLLTRVDPDGHRTRVDPDRYCQARPGMYRPYPFRRRLTLAAGSMLPAAVRWRDRGMASAIVASIQLRGQRLGINITCGTVKGKLASLELSMNTPFYWKSWNAPASDMNIYLRNRHWLAEISYAHEISRCFRH